MFCLGRHGLLGDYLGKLPSLIFSPTAKILFATLTGDYGFHFWILLDHPLLS